jgi:hypothetical protein
MYKVSNDNVLRERLNLLPIDKLFYNRQLQFLHRVACMDSSRPTFQTLTCQAARLGPEMKMTAGRKTNILSTWKNTLEKAGLTKKGSSGRLREWLPKLRTCCNEVIEHSLDLPQGSFRFKLRHQYSHNRV